MGPSDSIMERFIKRTTRNLRTKLTAAQSTVRIR